MRLRTEPKWRGGGWGGRNTPPRVFSGRWLATNLLLKRKTFTWGGFLFFFYTMPASRGHPAGGGRMGGGPDGNRRAVELSGDGKTVNRLLIVACLALLWMTAVFGRLGYLQLFLHSEFMARAQRQQQRVIEITPKRGAIYDRNMHPLAMSIPVDSAFAVPAELGDQQLAARLLAGVLGIPREVLEARLESSRSFVWIARKLPPEKKEAVEALNLKGVYFQK